MMTQMKSQLSFRLL